LQKQKRIKIISKKNTEIDTKQIRHDHRAESRCLSES
jgi:hypothetical protein